MVTIYIYMVYEYPNHILNPHEYNSPPPTHQLSLIDKTYHHIWLVVWNIFIVPYIWNHQPELWPFISYKY